MAIVYILTNECMSDIIKIGITDNLSRRLRELDNTSTPLPFECFYAVEVDDARAIEKLLHEAFDDKRVRPNREFFNCTPEQAKSALKISGGKDVTPKEVVFETEQDNKHSIIKRSAKAEWITLISLELMQVKLSPSQKIILLFVKLVKTGQVLFRGESQSLSGSALTIYYRDGLRLGTDQWCSILVL